MRLFLITMLAEMITDFTIAVLFFPITLIRNHVLYFLLTEMVFALIKQIKP